MEHACALSIQAVGHRARQGHMNISTKGHRHARQGLQEIELSAQQGWSAAAYESAVANKGAVVLQMSHLPLCVPLQSKPATGSYQVPSGGVVACSHGAGAQRRHQAVSTRRK
eukprot:scaffold12086_cov67-Phaeocystis_antarctica.AAC.14